MCIQLIAILSVTVHGLFKVALRQEAGFQPQYVLACDRAAWCTAQEEIDLILEQDGKLFPVEIKKMASPPKKLTRVFELIEKSPLQRGTGAILCMADKLSAFDQDNLIIPVSLIPQQHCRFA